MTQLPDIDAPVWHYMDGGQSVGPVGAAQIELLLRSGRLNRQSLLWRQGLSQWKPLGEVWTQQPPPAPAPTAAAGAAPAVRDVRQNCIAMFALFGLEVAMLGTMLVANRPVADRVVPDIVLGFLSWTGGLFAAIYVPLRWRAIRGLPLAYRVVGLIGGFGLILFFGLGLLMAGGAYFCARPSP